MADLQLDFMKGNIKQQLAELPEQMESAALEAIDQIADEMVNIAKGLCPVDTGSLQESIRKEHAGKIIRVRAGGYVTNPRTKRIVDYAPIVEIRQPFLRPAYGMVREKALALIKQHVTERVNK